MTRSLVVTTWFPDAQNPSRTPFCLAHVHALRDAGIDVEVVHVRLGVSAPPAQEIYEGVPVTRLAVRLTRPRGLMDAVLVVRAALGRSDVLHTMAFSSILVAVLPWLLRRRPWLHTEHWNGVINPRSVGRVWRFLSFGRHLLRLPDVVTGVTEQLACEMQRFARPGSTRVVPCVVPHPSRFAPFPPPEPLRLVGVGLLNDRKDPIRAVEAVALLRRQGVDVRFTWIGQGPLESVVRRRIDDLGLTDVVTLTGAIEPSRVQREIEATHLFFVPSAQENFFTALAEAIAVGRPGVVPRSGGFVEYCTPENSEVVDGRDVATLSAAIRRAQQRFALRTPAEIAATTASRFSAEHVGHLFRGLYDEVIERRG